MHALSVDHVVVAVGDLDEAADAFDSIGFRPTATSHHPFGTANRLIMLADIYVELVAVTDGSKTESSAFARFVAEAIGEGRFGPIMVVFRTTDTTGDRVRLETLGLPVSEPLRFGRDAIHADGSVTRVEFETLFTHVGSDRVDAFYCQHLTPESMWHPSDQIHPNGATSLIEIGMDDPGTTIVSRVAAMADADVDDRAISLDNTTLTFGSQPRLRFQGTDPGSIEIPGTNVTVSSP